MLRTTGLTKRYGQRTALEEPVAARRRGQFVALLGPNGAGKSTLFQVLTGLFAADEGEVEVAGHSLRTSATARAAPHRRGVPADRRSTSTSASARNLLFQADLQGLPRARWRAQRIEAGCARLGLDADLDRKVRELSGGNRRKVELVRAALHRPSVLLMDEATVGLDPKSRRTCWPRCMPTCASAASACCGPRTGSRRPTGADRVLVLHKGALLADGTPAEVTRALGGATLEAGFIARTA